MVALQFVAFLFIGQASDVDTPDTIDDRLFHGETGIVGLYGGLGTGIFGLLVVSLSFVLRRLKNLNTAHWRLVWCVRHLHKVRNFYLEVTWMGIHFAVIMELHVRTSKLRLGLQILSICSLGWISTCIYIVRNTTLALKAPNKFWKFIKTLSG